MTFLKAGALALLALSGCRTGTSEFVAANPRQGLAPPADLRAAAVDVRHADSIARVAFEENAAPDAPEPEPEVIEPEERASSPEFSAPDGELDLAVLVDEVVRRNPSVQAAVADWQAAARRYPQVIALDDPMLETMHGPASWGSDDVEEAYMVGVSQKVPWHGKRQLRGQQALAEASAESWEVRDTQVRLAEAATLAFLDYYLARRQNELNAENIGIMREFREIAQTRYEANQVPQQDVLQADVEIGELERREAEFNRAERVAIARINTLLHRPPDHPLPPPPQHLAVGNDLPAAAQLRQIALQQRPDLAAQAARIQADRIAIELACKEYYPDFEFVARYDAFWQPRERDLRPQVGMNLNIPLNQDRRRAAVDEALFRLSSEQAAYARQADEVQHEVESAHARVEESRTVVELYRGRIVPAAESNVEAARAGYVAGTIDFLRLIQAQKQLVELREREVAARAESRRRLAELERTVAGPLSGFSEAKVGRQQVTM